MMVTSHFFHVGGTMEADAPSYIQRSADRRLLQGLEQHEVCLILAPRQTGKSSLMIQTLARLKRKGAACGLADMQSLSQYQHTTPEPWFRDVLDMLGRTLGLDADVLEWWDQHSRLGPTRRFSNFFEDLVLKEKQGDVVIFFDEIDSVLALPFSDDFFTSLRALYNARAVNPQLKRLAFVLLGVASASEFVKDRTRTPFNIGKEIPLEDFSRTALRPFDESMGPNGPAVMDRIHELTSGQPLMVQKLASTLFKKVEESACTPKTVDQLAEKIYHSINIEKDPHLKFIQDYILEGHKHVNKALKIYFKVIQFFKVPYDKNSTVHNRLLLSGIVRIEKNNLIPRNQIYCRVFDNKWIQTNTPRDIAKIIAVFSSTLLIIVVTWFLFSTILLFEELSLNQIKINFKPGITSLIGTIISFVCLIFGVINLKKAFNPISKARRDLRILHNKLGRGPFDPNTIAIATRYFIRPKCSNIDPAQEKEIRHALVATREDLFEKVDEFIEQDTGIKHLFILADSGMGKTTFMLNYYAYNRQRRKKKSHLLAIVPLGYYNSDEMILEVPQMEREKTVLFLDAFDEDTRAIQDHQQRIAELMRLCRNFKRVIITCRTQFFRKDEEIPKETGIVRIGPRRAGVKGSFEFRKLYLAPFDDRDVRRYLTQRYPFWRWRERHKAYAIVNQIPMLSVRPMLLAYIPDVIGSGVKITYAYELYELMIEAWLERESAWVEENVLQEFSERLAVDIYINNVARGMERTPLKKLTGLARKWDLALEDWQLGGRSLLNRDADGNFKFAHRSIMEYLYVKRFLKMTRVERPSVEWTDMMKSFVIEKIKHQTAGRRLQRVDLSGSNLTGVPLENIDLTEANLDDCVFSKTNLKAELYQGASLVNAQFDDVKIEITLLEKADFKDVDFSRTKLYSPFLEADFVYIPPGAFLMGSPPDEAGRSNNEKQHEATLTQAFIMQTTQVTQQQWHKVMGSNPSHFNACSDCPVENVSWNDVQEFINKLNGLEETNTYRLPSETEWEYACRAGTTTAYNWGDVADYAKANYGSGYSDECKNINPGKTMPVKSFQPNNWGLYDMHGNVWEWCQDWYGDYLTESVTDPSGPSTGEARVLRGGSWGNSARNCRSAIRDWHYPSKRNNYAGFRLVRSLPFDL